MLTFFEFLFMKVFLLDHVHETEFDKEDVKFIGVYSSKKSAKEAIARLSTKPGFKKYIKGFQISCYELDKVRWTEEFVTTWVNEAGEIEYDDL